MTDVFTDIRGVRHGDRALVLNPVLKSEKRFLDDERALQETEGLARAIDLDVVEAKTLFLNRTVPSTLLGRGQVEQCAELVAEEGIILVVVNHALSPIQQRNLERAFHCKVIDRTGVILEIFGDRARTREGKLQVELAALEYQKSRLVKSWTHLERQRGGFGFLGGPGESQLEVDRRLIVERIVRLKKDLDQVRRTRRLGRSARHRAGKPTIAFVGYTNAGKSTLFNRLTGADVLSKNMLFATLDPTMRALTLPGGQEAILSDTVGFITDLPTNLVEAFRATLEEVVEADVLVHVRDVAHPDTKRQRDAVMSVLGDLGIEADDPRLIEALNKIDLLPDDERARLKLYAARVLKEGPASESCGDIRPEARGGVVGVSALTGEGMDELLRLIERVVSSTSVTHTITLSLSDGAALSWLYAHGKILERKEKKTKVFLKVEMDAASYGRFESRFGENLEKKV
ncbi:MAG: GTPase HflX [Alphaproteobacteria bacterium]|nr:GTPase HflX [Alphaproteobacteria bacterium]